MASLLVKYGHREIPFVVFEGGAKAQILALQNANYGGEQPDALRGSWQDLLQTESSLLAALRQYPGNIFLNKKLLDLRSQQLQFVKQLALLEQNNWRRT